MSNQDDLKEMLKRKEGGFYDSKYCDGIGCLQDERVSRDDK